MTASDHIKAASGRLQDRRGGGRDLRGELKAALESAAWERTITALIILNAVSIGLETSAAAMSRFGGLLNAIDAIILTIFVIEISLRIFVYRGAFWRDGWSLFDFTVVAIALVPATGGFSVLRALRVIRVLRLISTVKSMRRVVNGLLQAIPSMGAVIALLGLIFYVFSVMATKLYGPDFPALFGTIGDSAFSLFQVMTLEGWAAEIVRPVMEKYPYAWIFFIIFILITSFAVLNLFIGIIVDAMQSEQEAEISQDRVRSAANFDTLMSELRCVREELAALRRDQLSRDDGNRQAKLDV
ncbi:ion transporter [Rhodomicrobium sp. R_RK_3]|uniref:ion transporter n=1 Tax=Rhodomicrobium TaxID=1068 RepID=UPI0032AFCD4C